ncbi:hypothetical protein HRI_003201700 [Hibiscus trionum]|uniref:BZIP domain-containing protein n=1 Tax=Hibiscus trionum TaxID=183268 RepID=A0A9W7IEE4_HIBTR|nr:hypothetical protein HRI_003201700 [Hibiscus trionum]
MDGTEIIDGSEEDMHLEYMVYSPSPPSLISVMNGAEGKYRTQPPQPYGSNFLPTQPDPSQLNESRSISEQKLEKQRAASRERSQRNRRNKKIELETLKNKTEMATENETILTEEIEKLTAEMTRSMNEIGNLRAEKMEWKKEKEQMTANMITAINTRIDNFEYQVNSRLEDIKLRIESLDTKVEGFHNEWMASVSGANVDDAPPT